MNKWDRYFYDISQVVASNSSCFSRKIGAVLAKDNSIIATGYNGPARGIPDCRHRNLLEAGIVIWIASQGDTCPRYDLGYRSGEGLEFCIAEHAERNCIANAARHGVNTFGSTMYMTCEIPCKNCLTLIINAGIKELVCTKLKVYDEQSLFIICHSDLIIRDYEGDTTFIDEVRRERWKIK